MTISRTLAGVAILVGMCAAATQAVAADRGPLLAQAAGPREQAPQGPHFDSTQGGGQQPHNPNAAPSQAGGPPAHFDPPRGDGQQPHRPGAASGQAGNGAPPHFDSTQGGGQQPHVPGRGAPASGR